MDARGLNQLCLFLHSFLPACQVEMSSPPPHITKTNQKDSFFGRHNIYSWVECSCGNEKEAKEHSNLVYQRENNYLAFLSTAAFVFAACLAYVFEKLNCSPPFCCLIYSNYCSQQISYANTERLRCILSSQWFRWMGSSGPTSPDFKSALEKWPALVGNNKWPLRQIVLWQTGSSCQFSLCFPFACSCLALSHILDLPLKTSLKWLNHREMSQ